MLSCCRRLTAYLGKPWRKWRSLLAVLFVCYLASYFAVSRYSLFNCRKYGAECFYYVPCDFNVIHRNEWLQWVHYSLVVVYYPIWSLDRWLGGPSWGYVGMTDLGCRASILGTPHARG